jgi:signal transduction histidine kinase
MIVNEYRTSPYRNPFFVERTGITAIVAEPLLYRDRLVGVITVNNEGTGQSFMEQDQKILALFATQAAIAIENARLHETTRRRAEQVATLNELTQVLTTELDPQAVGREILNAVQVLVPDTAGRLWLRAGDAEVLHVVAGVGLRDPGGGTALEFRTGEGLTGIAAATRQPVISRDVTTDPRFVNKAWAAAEGLVSCILVPLVYGDRLNGILAIFTRRPYEFTDEEISLLRSFANQAAIAIENARLYEAIQQHAATLESRVRQRTAELDEALRIKSQIMATMSHELRTPLNFILGFAQLLQEGSAGALTPKQAQFVDRIQKGGNWLLELVSNILELSLVQAGKSGLRLEAIPLSLLVQEVLDLVRVQATLKRLTVTTALDPGLPFVVADRHKLGQVLANLVLNAVKFTPEGGTITLTARRVHRDGESRGIGAPGTKGGVAPSAPIHQLTDSPIHGKGEWMELAVEDTGIGIKAEDLERVFMAFYRHEGSPTQLFGGAGVGLAVVRTLVELHGGRVWAESEGPGRGARFVVQLPLLEAPQPRRILVVEDEGPVLEALSLALQGVGYTVHRAANGAEALRLLAGTPPDLLLLDIGLPDMDGWEVLKQVRAEERTQGLPVLVLTGLEHVHADQALALGADEFLAKPVSARVLVETVDRLLAYPARERVPA